MKQTGYHLEFSETINLEEENILVNGQNEEAFKAKQVTPIRYFGVFIKDAENKVIGGITGSTYFGCLYVDTLWVREELRHQGLGTKLMAAAEKIGKERGCLFAVLNTMDWEAGPFYKKLGYEVDFIRHGFEKDSRMYFLIKKI